MTTDLVQKMLKRTWQRDGFLDFSLEIDSTNRHRKKLFDIGFSWLRCSNLNSTPRRRLCGGSVIRLLDHSAPSWDKNDSKSVALICPFNWMSYKRLKAINMALVWALSSHYTVQNVFRTHKSKSISSRNIIICYMCIPYDVCYKTRFIHTHHMPYMEVSSSC